MNLPGYDTWKLDSDPDNEEPEVEEIPDAPEPDDSCEDYPQDNDPMVEDEKDLWGV